MHYPLLRQASILALMAARLSQRLLSVLQLTRMALVFTAIADSAASLLLLARWMDLRQHGAEILSLPRFLAAATVSIGLYGFGMSLNDIIDRRRDQQIAADRPLPSGRIGIGAAHAICALLGLAAFVAGVILARFQDGEARLFTLALLIWTGLLIAFYDFAGKYLVAPGLLTLGLIRFFHATIAAPQLPLLWHPLLLLNHVTVLSAICYHLEQKRPPLTRVHWWAVLGGLGFIDLICILFVWWKRAGLQPDQFASGMWVGAELVAPAGAVVAFAIMALYIRRRFSEGRPAGHTLMLYGLLWLIVYDACFVFGYVGWFPALMVLLLLPAAYVSVQLMRAWSRIVLLSQKPTYQRAR
jgi:hypothetical protein